MPIFSRPYYTLDEAAAHLSGILRETLTIIDLKRLHTKGQIQIIEIDLDTYVDADNTRKSAKELIDIEGSIKQTEEIDDSARELEDIGNAAAMARLIRITKNRVKPIHEYNLIGIITKKEIERFVSKHEPNEVSNKVSALKPRKAQKKLGIIGVITHSILDAYEAKYEKSPDSAQNAYTFACSNVEIIEGLKRVVNTTLIRPCGTQFTPKQFREAFNRAYEN